MEEGGSGRNDGEKGAAVRVREGEEKRWPGSSNATTVAATQSAKVIPHASEV